MIDEGYSKSYRSKWSNPVFRNLLEAAIWSWMCDTAAWKETRVRFKGSVINLKRGQLVTSVRFIAQGFCLGEQSVRTFLDHLKSDTMIEAAPTHQGTIITICNYEKFQSSETNNNTPPNEQSTQDQHTPNTNKKKIRNKEEERINPIPLWMPTEEWEAFKQMRKAIRKPITAQAEKVAVGKLDRWRAQGHDPAEILNYSILNGYPGIYEPKEKHYGKSNQPNKDERAKAAVVAGVQQFRDSIAAG